MRYVSLFFLLSTQFLFGLPSTEEVFWWWDDGLISYEELEDFLEAISKEDTESFCDLQLAYLNQKCAAQAKEKKYRTQYAEFHWKSDIDSTAHLQNQKFHLKMFYQPFQMDLYSDTSFTITYKRKQNRAVLGDISYSYFKAGLPLQKQKGYFGRYYIHKNSIAAFLGFDQNLSFQVQLAKKESHFYFQSYRNENKHFILFRYQHKVLDAILFYDFFQKSPLVRFRLKQSKQKNTNWAWNADFYILEQAPQEWPLKLPKSIAQSSFWSAQNQDFFLSIFKFSFQEKWRLDVESKEHFTSLQGALTMYFNEAIVEGALQCREVKNKCEKPLIRLKAQKTHFKTFKSILKMRLMAPDWYELKHRPQIILGFSMHPEKGVLFKNEFILPEQNNTKKISWRQTSEYKPNNHFSFLCYFESFISKTFFIEAYRTSLSLSLYW